MKIGKTTSPSTSRGRTPTPVGVDPDLPRNPMQRRLFSKRIRAGFCENRRAGRPKVEFCEFIHVFKRPLAKIELRSNTDPKLSTTKTFPKDFQKIAKPTPAFRKSWGKVFVVDSFRTVPPESYPPRRLFPRIFEKLATIHGPKAIHPKDFS